MGRSRDKRKLLAILSASALLTAWLPVGTALAENEDGDETGQEIAQIEAPAPEPIPEPAPEPAPEATPAPETTPVTETAPEPAPEGIPAPETTPVGEIPTTPETTPVPETTPAPETTPKPETSPEATVIDPTACTTFSGSIEWNGHSPVAVTFSFSGGGSDATCSSSSGYTFSVPKYAEDDSGSFTDSGKTKKYALVDYSGASISAGSVTIAAGTYSFTPSGKNFSANFVRVEDTAVYTSADLYIPVLNDVAVTHKDMLPDSLKAFYETQDSAALTELQSLSRAAHSESGIDFAELTKRNAQIAGWLELDGSALDCPVVQGIDNNYYLSHSAEGDMNRCGTLFIDSGCDGVEGRNTVVYGRNMSNGTLFGELMDYQSQDYYDGHRTIDYYTPEGRYQLKVFAAFTGGDRYGTVTKLDFKDDGEFTAFAASCAEKSVIKTGVEVEAGDKLMTLVTGTNRDAAERFVVMCAIRPAQ